VPKTAYDAPEFQPIKISVAKSADIFSLGLVFMELWFRKSVTNLLKKGQKTYQAPDKYRVAQLVTLCLYKNPRRRRNVDLLLQLISGL